MIVGASARLVCAMAHVEFNKVAAIAKRHASNSELAVAKAQRQE
jgi:hypothetical protein